MMVSLKVPTFLLALGLSAGAASANSHGMVPGSQFLNAWDLDADGAATLAEMEEMRGTVFFMFDANEDGMLDGAEYAAFDEARNNDLQNHEGPPQSRARMQQVADGLGLAPNDANGDGSVTLAEFLAATPAWLDAIDRDGDGVVTSADFGR